MTAAIARDPIYRRRRFQSEIIELCVRWYLTYRLSYRDLVEMLAERGVNVSHTTIYRWVQRYVPEFERRWARYAKPVHPSGRVDETAIAVRGGDCYLYRAVDKFGKTVDSLLCADRSVFAARAFFCRSLKTHDHRWPWKLNLDGSAASHRALRLLRQEDPNWQSVEIRSCRYLNNIVEQDHRAINSRCAPMLALKSFRTAAVTLAGVELVHRIKKGQFSLGSGAARGLSSLKHLWAHALKRRGARAQDCSDATQPPMQQNSPVRLRTEQDVRDIKRVRYARKVTVGRGLYLLVTPRGGRCWHYRFTFAGRRKKLCLGTYPEVSLDGAKTRHEYARHLLAHGIDPCETKAILGKNAFFLRIREWEIAQNHARDVPRPRNGSNPAGQGMDSWLASAP
jgi:transposase-like protein